MQALRASPFRTVESLLFLASVAAAVVVWVLSPDSFLTEVRATVATSCEAQGCCMISYDVDVFSCTFRSLSGILRRADQ